MSAKPHYGLFAPLLHTVFSFHRSDTTADAIPMTLVHVAESGHLPGYEQFSLRWHGPLAPALPQGTHRVTHGQIGEMEIFIVPIGCDADGTRYEAVFSVRRGEACA